MCVQEQQEQEQEQEEPNPFVWTGPGENIFSKSSFATYVDVDTVCLEKLSFFIFKIIRGT